MANPATLCSVLPWRCRLSDAWNLLISPSLSLRHEHRAQKWHTKRLFDYKVTIPVPKSLLSILNDYTSDNGNSRMANGGAARRAGAGGQR